MQQFGRLLLPQIFAVVLFFLDNCCAHMVLVAATTSAAMARLSPLLCAKSRQRRSIKLTTQKFAKRFEADMRTNAKQRE